MDVFTYRELAAKYSWYLETMRNLDVSNIKKAHSITGHGGL
jgi:hypothetical protein